MKALRPLLYVLLALPSVGPAGTPPDDEPRIVTASSFLSARDNWEQNDYQDYRYTLEQECYCPQPKRTRVTVRAGRVTGVTDLGTGRPLSAAEAAGYPTVSGLFRLIDRSVGKRPDSMTIVYHRSLGYPERIRIDFSYRVADDELDYRLSGMEILDPRTPAPAPD